MFIIGTTTVKKLVKNGLRVQRTCGRCHFLSEMQEHSFRPYFTFFFIPVVPIGKGESLLVCSRCQAAFYPQPVDYLAVEKGSASAEKAVITCPDCNGRLRVPARIGRKLLVTCPHCKKKFDLELDERI